MLVSATQRATIAGLQELRGTPDAATLATHAHGLDAFIATWQMLDVAVFLPFYMAVSARLRAGAGDVEGAGSRVDEALEFARAKGMHFYDAELLRLRAGWAAGGPDDGDAARQLRAARKLARAQGATLFERRIARDLQRAQPS